MFPQEKQYNIIKYNTGVLTNKKNVILDENILFNQKGCIICRYSDTNNN